MPIEYCCCFVAVLEGCGFLQVVIVSDQLRVQGKYGTQQYFDTDSGVMPWWDPPFFSGQKPQPYWYMRSLVKSENTFLAAN